MKLYAGVVYKVTWECAWRKSWFKKYQGR